jgi:hypothetical protein
VIAKSGSHFCGRGPSQGFDFVDDLAAELMPHVEPGVPDRVAADDRSFNRALSLNSYESKI